MSNLSEHDIKRSTLRFLKGYYKNRPRKGETDASMDMRGEGGIIADGFLSFETEKGDQFISTFEATSAGTSDEVRFKVQSLRLFWDAFATASLIAGIWLGWNYYSNERFLDIKGYTWTVKVIISVVGIVFFFLLVALRRRKRYRYIYAVEQFKQYHANEQWISIGEDVFVDNQDRYLNELKDQCIRNGFGLIKVNKVKEEDVPHLIVTPSRQGTFNKQRRSVQFLPLEEMGKRLGEVNYQKWLGWMDLRQWAIFKSSKGISRFYSSNSIQISIAGLSWLLIFGIFPA